MDNKEIERVNRAVVDTISTHEDKRIKSYFSSIADSYNSRLNQEFYGDLARRLCRAIIKNNIKPKKIIEIGCGCGFATAEIVKYFPDSDIITIDPVTPLLDMAKKRVGERVKFLNLSLAELDEECQADLLIANMSYHWLSDHEKMALAARVKAGGSIVALTVPLRATYSPLGLGRNYSGNAWLIKAFKKVVSASDIRDTRRSWRGLDQKEIKNMGVSPCRMEKFKVIELFEISEFLRVIISRGLVFAIFGDKSDAAVKWLRKHLPSEGYVKLAWPLATCLITPPFFS